MKTKKKKKEPNIYKTLKVRLCDRGNLRLLEQIANETNMIWNYVQAAHNHFDYTTKSKYQYSYDFNDIPKKKDIESGQIALYKQRYADRKSYIRSQVRGVSKSPELLVRAQTCQEIIDRYLVSRKANQNRPLRWRTGRRSLPWIPVMNQSTSFDVKRQIVTYGQMEFKTFKCYDSAEGRLKSAEFVKDSLGHWYWCGTYEIVKPKKVRKGTIIGIDLGKKNMATCSDGYIVESTREYKKMERELARLQRKRSNHDKSDKAKRRLRKKFAYLKNKRKDYLHKESSKLVNRGHKMIMVGDLSAKVGGKKSIKSNLDVSYRGFLSMLKHKCEYAGIGLIVLNEAWTTITCSHCGNHTGPRGQAELKVREWTCSECGVHHDRDINSAINMMIKHYFPDLVGNRPTPEHPFWLGKPYRGADKKMHSKGAITRNSNLVRNKVQRRTSNCNDVQCCST